MLPSEICTGRLRLRGPIAADAAAIFNAYSQDLEVCRYMIWTPHASESVTRDFIAACIDAWSSGSRKPYVITTRDSDVAVGMLDTRAVATTVTIGYVLARAHWGKGFMPEAIQSLVEVALSNPGVFRLQATCDVENIASQRALEKSGFAREGRLERYSIHPNVSAEPRACFMYARCR